LALTDLIAEGVLYVLPAYAANGAPVVIVRMLGRSHPLDLGKTWGGRRILGDGKTFEGLLSGLLVGLAVSAVLGLLGAWPYRAVEEAVLVVLGALVGDVAGSFVKRRLGLPRGSSAPLMDQLGFVLFALIFASLPRGPPRWALLEPLAAVLTITAALHLGTNALAYFLRLKDRWY
jgi:Putative integral membrane protein DUF46.